MHDECVISKKEKKGSSDINEREQQLFLSRLDGTSTSMMSDLEYIIYNTRIRERERQNNPPLSYYSYARPSAPECSNRYRPKEKQPCSRLWISQSSRPDDDL
eukprot:scaffold17653_cov68-Cylindrotheca_fusiformis.AAC.2